MFRHTMYKLCVANVAWTTFFGIVKSSEVDLDSYGTEYIRATVGSHENKTYAVSLQNEDQYIYMTGSSSVHYSLLHVDSGTQIRSSNDSNHYAYFLLTPESTKGMCESYDDCTFHLTVSNIDSSSRSIWLRFNRNLVAEPHRVYTGIVELRKRRRYAMRLTAAEMPVLVRLIPNQAHEMMDIDLYGYLETSFSSYYFPNQLERNHIKNYAEQLLITPGDNYYSDGQWHFFEVYGSTDSQYQEMDYTFEIITNYEPDNLFTRILMIFGFSLVCLVVVTSLVSVFCKFRNRLFFWIGIRSSPHANGASKRQIRKLKIVRYKSSETADELESNQCTICLEEYQEGDKIRVLKCNHCFHVHCSDEWLFINNKCPLCQQNIAQAKDVHHQLSLAVPSEEPVEMQEFPVAITPSSCQQEISINNITV